MLWSTSANQPAGDGELQDGHGPFAAGFLKCVGEHKQPSLDDLRDLLNSHVSFATKNQQKVHLYSAGLDRVPCLFGPEIDRRSTMTDETRSRSSLLTLTSRQTFARRDSCPKAFGILCLLCAVAIAAAAWTDLRDCAFWNVHFSHF